MENEEGIKGSLFNVIKYKELSDLDSFINNMKKDQAFYCLIQAVNYAYNNKIYTIQESEVISKSIRLLTNQEDENRDIPDPEVYNA
jgi:hypothetical protein